jgi:hypothetical protein
VINENGRSVAGVVAELKQEGKEFFETRVAMLKSEMRDMASAWKAAAPMIAVGVLLLLTAWILLTWAFVSIIAYAFGTGPMAWFFAFLIVGVAYALIGGLLAAFAYSQLKQKEIVPRRTLRVLKEDQIWLQREARTTQI